MKTILINLILFMLIPTWAGAQVTLESTFTLDCSQTPPVVEVMFSVLGIDGTISNLSCTNMDVATCIAQENSSVVIITGESSIANVGLDITLSIQDDNGSNSFSVTIPSLSPLTYVINETPTCGNSGALALMVLNGELGGFVIWIDDNNNIVGVGENLTGLSPGDYSVIITDALCGNSILDVATVNDVSLAVITESTSSACMDSDGSIDITVTGGSGNYSYSWTGGSCDDYTSSSEDPIDLLIGGNYLVDVSDINDTSCTAYHNVNVLQGDFNCDCYVTVSDMTTFLSFFGEQVGDSPNNNLADFNCDGQITVDDLSLFFVDYGQNCD